MPYCVTEVQPTPNPNAMKFLLDRPISEGSVSFLKAEQAQDDPVARALFAIPGVTSVLLLCDLVTVNKDPQAAWPQVKRRVQQVLAEL